MAERLEEHAIDCPCCGSRFTALIDPTEAGDEYFQDCEICCNPIRFHIRIDPEGFILIETGREHD